MPCVGATTRVCGGLVTGEPCIIPKAITNNLPPLEELFISGGSGKSGLGDASITVTWDSSPDYADQNIRSHIREAGQIGYSPDQIQVVPRSDGAVSFTGLTAGMTYNFWIRVEDADEANRWDYAIGQPGDVNDGYFYGVTHNGILVEFQGNDVTFGG